MKYLKVTGNSIQYPYNLTNLRYDYPNTSFPQNLEQIDLEAYDIFQVVEVQKPSDEGFTKLVSEITPIKVQDTYFQNWIVEDAPQEYTQEMIVKQTQAKWSEVRSVRNQYLLESDWTQLEDAPFNTTKKNEWKSYRQDLRDITNQSDPFNIVWPVKPQ